MQTKLFINDYLKAHFTGKTIDEANDIKHEMEDMGYRIILFRVKPHRGKIVGG